MRTLVKTAAAALLVASILALAGCGTHTSPQGAKSSNAGTEGLGKVVLQVPTIWCSTCWPRVEASARSVPGVAGVKFDKQEIEKVVVSYDPALTTTDAIVEAIERGGDKVTKVTEP